ncbi:Hypothetical protein A7982_09900 [Minicystis rosea]|nr:Hypothetical protein A7982_09900 [Minicystis rosea]
MRPPSATGRSPTKADRPRPRTTSLHPFREAHGKMKNRVGERPT